MAKIENFEGILKSFDSDKKTLELYIPPRGTCTVRWDDSHPLRSPTGTTHTFRYKIHHDDELLQKALDEEREYFAGYLGKKVRLILQNKIVVEIVLTEPKEYLAEDIG